MWDSEFSIWARACISPFLKKIFTHLFLAALGLYCCERAFSGCGALGLLYSCGTRASHWGGFCCCRACALEHRFSSCVTLVWLPRGLWDLPGIGIEPTSSASAGGSLTTGPPGKSDIHFLIEKLLSSYKMRIRYLKYRFSALEGEVSVWLPGWGWLPHPPYLHLPCTILAETQDEVSGKTYIKQPRNLSG